ncbi:MAG: DeoR/GlpR family DNA-binding transcription regulator [Lactobacillus sp.]|jgi:DeoR family fructose operon transcriptional repressor|nr:DeoR/GlpR family DNA-binding transcription regulator [Lactobacillus sp.]MCI2032286.1 DeoR/GlpR family DNA-binding transcription regulator [Lactobacillus sp.]
MLTEERQHYIINQLQQQPVVKLKALMQALSASESTIRRDLCELEDAGKLRRIHGGAERLESAPIEPSVHEKAARYLIEKQRIAQAAVQLVPEHATVFLDAGTTTAQLIPLLKEKAVTVVTTGVDNASALADANITAMILGGKIKSATKATVGAETVAALQQRHFDVAFIGANGIHPKFGLTTPDAEEAVVKQTALAQAHNAIILADPSKFGEVSFAKIAPLTAATILTTSLTQLSPVYADYPNIQEVTS